MGTVVLDAGVIIGFRDQTDAHHTAAERAVRDARSRGDTLALPASVLSEALVRPAFVGDDAVSRWLEMVDRLPIAILSIDSRVAVDAARLRAAHRSLKLPDALVIATARVHGATELVTTDNRWPTKRALKFAGKLTVL